MTEPLPPATPAQISPPAQTKPETAPTPPQQFDARRLSFFIPFCICIVVFWIAQFLYQYLVFEPGSLSAAIVRGSSIGGMTLIAAALFSSAIFKWYPKYARHWPIRRYLGVAGFLMIAVHGLSVIFLYFGGNLRAVFYSLNPVKNPIIYGVFAALILLAMAITSTDRSMQRLGKNWKRLHRWVYAAFAAAILHAIFIHLEALLNPPGYLLMLTTALAVFGQLFWFFKTIYQKRFRSLGTAVGFLVIISFLVLLYLGLKNK